MSRCPPTFEQDGEICRLKCPREFKYVDKSCVYKTDNAYSIELMDVPIASPMRQFSIEQQRFEAALRDVRKQIQTPQPTTTGSSGPAPVPPTTTPAPPTTTPVPPTTGSSGPAPFTSTVDMLKSVSDSLTPHRPPTAPASDIEQERRSILQSSAPSMLLIHVSLFAVVLCLLAYAFIPVEYAHWISLVVLSMAVAVGIFLWK